MIYKKQSLKSRVENLHSWLFSFIILMIVVNASVKAQDLDDRSRFKTVTTLDATRNDTIAMLFAPQQDYTVYFLFSKKI